MATPKVRDSCDQCSQQKIKCGKQRPRCARCVSKGLDTCHYSVSMRIGRPPRNRSEPVPAESIIEDSASPPPGNSTDQDWPMMSASILLDDLGWTLASDTLSTSKEIFDTQFSLDEDITIEGATPRASETRADLLQHVPPAPIMRSQPPSTAGPCHSSSAPRDESYPAISSASGDCLTCIIQLVDDMHVRNPLCNDRTGSYHHSNMRGVDMVLMRNRVALSTLAKAVDCPCFHTQGCIHLASYLLVSAVVSGYGAILKSGDTINGKPATTLSITDSVAPSPMYMGSYELNEAAQRGIRGRIVLTELKNHLEPLLERLPRVSLADETSQATNDFSMPGSATSVTPLEVQECVLREQLRSLVSAASRIP